MARKVSKLFKTADELMSAYFPTTENKAKEPIKLRAKKLAKSLSLYLDFYQNGKREYQFLNLYLNLEADAATKEQNRQTLEIARTIQQEKVVTFNKTGAGFVVTSKSKVNLIKYILCVADKALEKSGNKHGYYYTLQALAKHISVFKGDSVTLADVDKDFILAFIEYLRTAKNGNYTRAAGAASDDRKKAMQCKAGAVLSQNTQHNLFMKFKYVLNHAVKEEIILANPMAKLDAGDKPREEAGTREFLSLDEIKLLIKTDCKNEMLKRAFLFCCLVGLRYSDISSITWGELTTDVEGDAILRFKMKKVGRENNPYVSDEALRWLPERGDASDADVIFTLPRNDSANVQLERWVKAAGITKHITFHCSRHTAATLNLALGVPMEIVSKMLGHTKLATTQIYAKLMDKQRKDAVNKQNGIFND